MGSTPSPGFPVDPSLTPAERRVLQELERGRSNKAIAAALIVSPRTVESHMSNLLAKTGCQSRTQLLLWAISGG
ncbi:MAG: helix-turn-helix transcriptional regulator [Synechococcus sp.]|jgi:DNA-binding CsgD family transcriptional regulator|nr:helix-turn-helix transcriptional regulator [Synechococcus sp.]